MPEIVYLSDPEHRLRIGYSRAAMEQIRAAARDGLMAAPRVGMGVGGLLLGVRSENGLTLVDSIEISCCHAAGPSFHLTETEREAAVGMVAEARMLEKAGSPIVIGWYCSKPRGEASLNENDRRLHRELFPGSWQVALAVRPDPVEPMRARFFFQDENGELLQSVECSVDEWLSPAAAIADSPKPAPLESDPLPRATLVAEPVVPKLLPANEPLPAPSSTVTRLADIIGLSEGGPAPGPNAEPLDRTRLFGVPPPLPSPPKRRGKLLWVLSVAAGLGLGAAAFFTQDMWVPKPDLALTSNESNGNLTIHWNADALRGIDHATMYVNDGGGQPQALPLDRFQLHSGILSYKPRSNRVTAKLDAGETTGITAWFAPLPAPAVAQPETKKPADTTAQKP